MNYFIEIDNSNIAFFIIGYEMSFKRFFNKKNKERKTMKK